MSGIYIPNMKMPIGHNEATFGIDADGHPLLAIYTEKNTEPEIYYIIPAADMLPRDEGIKLGAELAAMHGATPEQQQLEEAYLKGVEYGMTRRDVRPVVRGRWVKARGSWCTPGGDPVWECSECGKGQHVYGIEHGSYGADVADGQWVTCPNCGAEMRKDTDEQV